MQYRKCLAKQTVAWQQNKKGMTQMKKRKITISKIIDDLKEAIDLVDDASSLLDYEDEKNPTYGIKFRCERFLRKIRKDYPCK